MRPLRDAAAVVPCLTKSQRTLPEGGSSGRGAAALGSLLVGPAVGRTAVGFLSSGVWWPSMGRHGMPPEPLSLGPRHFERIINLSAPPFPPLQKERLSRPAHGALLPATEPRSRQGPSH